MIDLLNSLALVVVSIVMVTVTGGLPSRGRCFNTQFLDSRYSSSRPSASSGLISSLLTMRSISVARLSPYRCQINKYSNLSVRLCRQHRDRLYKSDRLFTQRQATHDCPP